MAIFNSYVKLPEGNGAINHTGCETPPFLCHQFVVQNLGKLGQNIQHSGLLEIPLVMGAP